MERSKSSSGSASDAAIASTTDAGVRSVAVDHGKKMYTNGETLNRSQATSSTTASIREATKTQLSSGRDEVASDLDAYMAFIDRVAERMRNSSALIQPCPHHQHRIRSECHQVANMHPIDRYCLSNMDQRTTIYYCENSDSSDTISSCSCEAIMRASYYSQPENPSPSS